MRGMSPISCVPGGIINMYYLLLPNNNDVWIGVKYPKKIKNLNFSLRDLVPVLNGGQRNGLDLREEGYAKSPRRN